MPFQQSTIAVECSYANDQLVLRNRDSNVLLYYDDHGPPHFHAYYGQDAVVVEIETLRVIAGRLPRRAQAMVLEWAAERREQLRIDWFLAEGHQPLVRIEPLE